MNALDPYSVAVGILLGAVIVMCVLGIAHAWDEANAKLDRLLFEANVEDAMENSRERPADANIRAFNALGRSANR